MQYAISTRHIVICGLSDSTELFSTQLINGKIFEKKKKIIENKTCVLIFSATFVRNIFHSRKN